MTTERKRKSLAVYFADAEAFERPQYNKRLEFLDRLATDTSLSTLHELHARGEAEQSFHLNLLRSKLAILAGRFAQDGCIPVDLVDAARRAAHGRADPGEVVDE